MPGLSFVFEADKTSNSCQNKALSILNSLSILPEYQNSLLKSHSHWSLYSSQYPGYPINQYDMDSVLIIIEGKIYNKPQEQINHEIQSITEKLIQNPEAKDILSEWLLNTDGEYIIFVFHKQSGTVLIFNDVFSHLPAYYAISDNKLYLSRSLNFVHQTSNIQTFDTLAISLFLIFSYYPFNKTFLENIKRLEPASLIYIPGNNTSIQKRQIHAFNFDHKEHEGKSLRSCAKELAEIQAHAAQQRCAQAKTNIMMLTGGMDSRAVAAAMHKKKAPYISASWLDYREVAKKDVLIAEKIAEILGIEWNLYNLPPARGIELYRLLRSKDGFHHFNRSHINYFFQQLIATYGRQSQLVTGNTGWSLRYVLPTGTSVKNLQDVCTHILKSHSIFPVQTVSELTGVSENTIQDEIIRNLEKYPEMKMEQKYAHFIIHERAINYLLQGSDRHRQYLWHVYPDMSLPFFRFAMNCPDSYKKDYVLYKTVLRELCAPLVKIQRVSGDQYKYIDKPLCKKIEYGCYLANPARLFKKYVLKRKRPKIKTEFHYPESIIKILTEQFEHSPVINETFSETPLKDILDNCQHYRTQHISTLFSLFSAMEYFSTKTSTLEKYPDEIIDPFV